MLQTNFKKLDYSHSIITMGLKALPLLAFINPPSKYRHRYRLQKKA